MISRSKTLSRDKMMRKRRLENFDVHKSPRSFAHGATESLSEDSDQDVIVLGTSTSSSGVETGSENRKKRFTRIRDPVDERRRSKQKNKTKMRESGIDLVSPIFSTPACTPRRKTYNADDTLEQVAKLLKNFEMSDDDIAIVYEKIGTLSFSSPAKKKPTSTAVFQRDSSVPLSPPRPSGSISVRTEEEPSYVVKKESAGQEVHAVERADERIDLREFATQPEFAGKLYLAAIPLNAEEEKREVGRYGLRFLDYPLGVVYDEVSAEWIVADSNRLVFFPSGRVMECRLLRKPSAVMVYTGGQSLAVLSHDSLAIVGYVGDDFTLSIIADDLRGNARGLASTKNKNLISCVRDHDHWNVVVFKSQALNVRLFTVPFARTSPALPSFLDIYQTLLLASDLGQNALHFFRVNAKTDGVTHERTSILNYNKNDTEPCGRFSYVSEVFFDSSGLVLICDAGERSLQIFDTAGNFLQRVSFPHVMPYCSSFFVNKEGVMAVCQRQRTRSPLSMYKLCLIDKQMPHRRVGAKSFWSKH